MIPVIICGGFGTKLWPVSREHRPKHFLPIINGKSTFQLNYEALRTEFPANQIYVSTNEDQIKIAQIQAPEIPQENYILEPEMRNQGPATGLVAATLSKLGKGDEPFMIVQGDVLREPTDMFIKMLKDCDRLARSENKYITGGFKIGGALMGVDYLVEGFKSTKVIPFKWQLNYQRLPCRVDFLGYVFNRAWWHFNKLSCNIGPLSNIV